MRRALLGAAVSVVWLTWSMPVSAGFPKPWPKPQDYVVRIEQFEMRMGTPTLIRSGVAHMAVGRRLVLEWQYQLGWRFIRDELFLQPAVEIALDEYTPDNHVTEMQQNLAIFRRVRLKGNVSHRQTNSEGPFTIPLCDEKNLSFDEEARFGDVVKLVLHKDPVGQIRSWLEITVDRLSFKTRAEIEREARELAIFSYWR